MLYFIMIMHIIQGTSNMNKNINIVQIFYENIYTILCNNNLEILLPFLNINEMVELLNILYNYNIDIDSNGKSFFNSICINSGISLNAKIRKIISMFHYIYDISNLSRNDYVEIFVGQIECIKIDYRILEFLKIYAKEYCFKKGFLSTDYQINIYNNIYSYAIYVSKDIFDLSFNNVDNIYYNQYNNILQNGIEKYNQHEQSREIIYCDFAIYANYESTNLYKYGSKYHLQNSIIKNFFNKIYEYFKNSKNTIIQYTLHNMLNNNIYLQKNIINNNANYIKFIEYIKRINGIKNINNIILTIIANTIIYKS